MFTVTGNPYFDFFMWMLLIAVVILVIWFTLFAPQTPTTPEVKTSEKSEYQKGWDDGRDATVNQIYELMQQAKKGNTTAQQKLRKLFPGIS